MVPYLVTGPDETPVSLEEVKAHLRVLHNDEDADITSKLAGAVAALDAWGGLLGRCIMPQTWAIDVTGPGPHRLPFPEATDIVATGTSGVLEATFTRGAAGPCVTVADAVVDEELVIEFESAMPADRLPVVQTIVKLMVQREFDMSAGPEFEALTRAIDSLVNVVRWRRI